jgi:hypothetical protein
MSTKAEQEADEKKAHEKFVKSEADRGIVYLPPSEPAPSEKPALKAEK